MIINFEATVRPGENALFVTEVKIEKSKEIYPPTKVWWGLWIAWWLYPWRKRREWLWTWEKHDSGRWYTWNVMLCGFEINWQWRRKS